MIHPFWSDDFDMDLLKVLPETPDILGKTADVELVTQGHTSHGRLNHPAVWNTDGGLAAWFGFRDPARPTGFVCDHPLVRCTFLEVLRDAWSHTYLVMVERQRVWGNSRVGWELFQQLMYHRRGWHTYPAAVIETALAELHLSLNEAMARMELLVLHHTGAFP